MTTSNVVYVQFPQAAESQRREIPPALQRKVDGLSDALHSARPMSDIDKYLAWLLEVGDPIR